MKTSLFLLFFVFLLSPAHSQTHIEIGASFRPSLYLSQIIYFDGYNLMPSLDITIGNNNSKAIVSIGNNSRIGAQILTRFIYCSATYTLSILNTEQEAKHGASLEVGFNYDFPSENDCQRHRLQIGTSLAVLGKFSADYPEIALTPISISFFTRMNIKPKIKKSSKYIFAVK